MFHKEGFKIIIATFFITTLMALGAEYLIDLVYIKKGIQVLALVLLVVVLQFFRNPKRATPKNDRHIIAPVDGKVVVIEEVFEKEYFKDNRLQVSIFMSPINVHVTRYAISGKVIFSKYHPGKFLVAWHPKSSEENERTTVVLENKCRTNSLPSDCRSVGKKDRQLCRSWNGSYPRRRCRVYKIWLKSRLVFPSGYKNQFRAQSSRQRRG